VCGDEAVVGVGDPVRWVCLTHYQRWLDDVAAIWANFEERFGFDPRHSADHDIERGTP
jgi:hypothetical protein